MTGIPDGLPSLAGGAHIPEDGEACVMEYVSVIAGEDFNDLPECTDQRVAVAAWTLNDNLTDSDRHMLIPFISRLASARPLTAGESSEFLRRLFGEYFISGLPSMSYAVLQAPMRSAMRKAVGEGKNGGMAGVNFLDHILTTHEQVTGRTTPTPMSADALTRAKALVESRNYVPSV
jgi:hypothetical protein